MRWIKSRSILQTTMVLCIGLLIAGSVDTEAAQWGGYFDDTGGLLSVMNSDIPMHPEETIKTEELWRVGGDDDDEGELMGFVTDVIVDDEGISYLLDATLNTIHVFGPDGTLLRDIGRAGEGPGEFSNARQFIHLPNNNLGVIQMMPGQIVTLGLDGVPGTPFKLNGGGGGMSFIQNAGSSNHGVVVGQVATHFNETAMSSSHSLAVYDSEGKALHAILEKDEKMEGGSFSIGGGENQFTSRWSVGNDGRVYVAQYENEYKIEVFDAKGKADRVIFREYSSLKRSSEDIAEDEERNAELATRFGGAQMDIEVAQFERDIGTMHPRQNGQLWVSTSRGNHNRPIGAVGVFDEFDAEGKFVRQVSIEAEYDPERDNYVLQGDHLFILKEGQKQPETTSTSGGGGMRMIMISSGGSTDDEEEDEGLPPGVVCYKLVR